MTAVQQKKYRPNVAIVVVDDCGRILACRRNDLNDIWQIPQGGIDGIESPDVAMSRELEEEIGTNDVVVLGSLKNPIRYDWPEELYSRGFHGQEQFYYLVRIAPAAKIDLFAATKPEFDAYAWLSLTEFLSRMSGFKRPVYERAFRALMEEFPGVIKESHD